MQAEKYALIFGSRRSAVSFARGYHVPRVVVARGAKFEIVSPSTATRRGARIVWTNGRTS